MSTKNKSRKASPGTDPLTSAGARAERKSFRSHLRSQLRKARAALNEPQQEALQAQLDWVLSRQKRYDKKAGGL